MVHTLNLAHPYLSWYMDTRATSHMSSVQCNLLSRFSLNKNNGIIIGNDHFIPIFDFVSAILYMDHPPLVLKNVLHTPNIIKNLVFIPKLTIDNQVYFEFDPFGFSINDFSYGYGYNEM